MAAKSLVCIYAIIQCVQLINAQTYTAAVVEYTPLRTSTSEVTNLLENTREYVRLIEHARNRSAEIVVFPEYGLTTLDLPANLENLSTIVAHPAQRFAPCDSTSNNTKFLVDLSCAARAHRIYTVVNLIERETDASNNTIYYNTNVVFDRNGTIIARYRKINLYNEPLFAPGNELVSFSTDFGVNFGMFICWDILFKTPALDILDSGNITDILYSHAWFSETPFLSALSVQDGYARVNGINLLISGYSNATASNGGTGFVLANTTVSQLSVSTADGRNVLTQQVPRIATRTPNFVCNNQNPPEFEPRLGGTVPDISAFNTYVENLEDYTFEALPLSSPSVQGRVCSEGSDFCCTYSIQMTQPLTENSTIYKFAAFYGSRNVGMSTTIGVRACALLACRTEEDSTCGARLGNFTSNVQFSFISIIVSSEQNDETFYQPSTLTFQLQPVTNYTFCNTRNEENTNVIDMAIGEPQTSLLTFGVLGRVYSLDGQPAGRSDAYNAHLSMALIVLVFTYVFVQ